MEITRNNFDAETLAALDLISRLLYINQQLRGAAKPFNNSPELDKRQAKPDAVHILRYTSEISKNLLECLYKRSDLQTGALNSVYKKAAEGIDEAIEKAKVLAETEDTANVGNAIRVAVLGNLLELRNTLVA